MNRMGGEPRGSAVTTPHRADVEVFARHLDRERGRQRASDLHDKQRHPLSGGRTGSCKAGVRHSQQGSVMYVLVKTQVLGGEPCPINCGWWKNNKVDVLKKSGL